MRWKVPRSGDTRIITRFAYFPIEAGGEKRWLEVVRIKQRCWIGRLSDKVYWYNQEFVD